MTWLRGLPPGDTDWERVAALHPEASGALARVVAATWSETDPVLLELARLRIATLLGNTDELAARSAVATAAGVTERQRAELAAWPTSPEFGSRERACLAFAEQFVVDASGVTDEQVVEVVAHLGGAGCYAFTQAVSVMETMQRGCLALGLRGAPCAAFARVVAEDR